LNYFYFITLLSLTAGLSAAAPPSDQKLRMLYNSLDPTSLSQHLALYELYPDRTIGKKALQDACQLLYGKTNIDQMSTLSPISSSAIQALIALVNKQDNKETPSIPEEELNEFVKLSQLLPHHHLKGHHIWKEKEVWDLPIDQIDLARALFLSQFENDRGRISKYEALIDLMALQVLARLPKGASDEDKICAINTLVFDEMQFRFPPHSLHSKDIDLYTFLPSVIDSHRGVCLGVSILYLCLAQRLNLKLEMITPPGHIYVRHRGKDKMINIETTARGIHLDCESYLGINTKSLQQRTIKEVIGLAHFNQASLFWQEGSFEKAYQTYQKCRPYLQNDPLLKELTGYVCLLTNRQFEGESLLKEIKNFIPEYAVKGSSLAEDYLSGNVNSVGIALLFSRTDEDRAALLTKKETLEQFITDYPRFRTGLLQLAMTWLQLHRMGEALEILQAYHQLDPHDPEANYYLAILYVQRLDYPKAWNHLRQTERLLQNCGHCVKDVKELRQMLTKKSPE
jgi:tetratricopeptide (TPR) repeat protein